MLFLSLLIVVCALNVVQASVDYGALHGSSIRKSAATTSVGNPEWGTTVSPDMVSTDSAYKAASTNNFFNAEYVWYDTNDIPFYNHTVTSCDISYLSGRPHKSGEIATIKISEGQKIRFGTDIGFKCTYTGKTPQGATVTNQCACVQENSDNTYSYSASSCFSAGIQGEGLTICSGSYGGGFWPPGPSCPSDQTKNATSFKIPLQPRKNDQSDSSKRCYLPMGEQGYFVHGVPFYGFSDGLSYKEKGICILLFIISHAIYLCSIIANCW